MKITRRQLRQLIREALDTKLSRHRSKGNLPDARSDEKAAARRSQRRHDSKAIEAGLSDFADELEVPVVQSGPGPGEWEDVDWPGMPEWDGDPFSDIEVELDSQGNWVSRS